MRDERAQIGRTIHEPPAAFVMAVLKMIRDGMPLHMRPCPFCGNSRYLAYGIVTEKAHPCYGTDSHPGPTNCFFEVRTCACGPSGPRCPIRAVVPMWDHEARSAVRNVIENAKAAIFAASRSEHSTYEVDWSARQAIAHPTEQARAGSASGTDERPVESDSPARAMPDADHGGGERR